MSFAGKKRSAGKELSILAVVARDRASGRGLRAPESLPSSARFDGFEVVVPKRQRRLRAARQESPELAVAAPLAIAHLDLVAESPVPVVAASPAPVARPASFDVSGFSMARPSLTDALREKQASLDEALSDFLSGTLFGSDDLGSSDSSLGGVSPLFCADSSSVGSAAHSALSFASAAGVAASSALERAAQPDLSAAPGK